MTITEAQLDEWARLAEEATPGPWYGADQVRPSPEERAIPASVLDSGRSAIFRAVWLIDNKRWNRDAAFIAAAREAIPALIAEVRRLRATPSPREILKAFYDGLDEETKARMT